MPGENHGEGPFHPAAPGQLPDPLGVCSQGTRNTHSVGPRILTRICAQCIYTYAHVWNVTSRKGIHD